MKLGRLKLFEEEPRPKRACAACGAFAPECLVPVEDAAMPMCWLCAHHFVEHERALHIAATAQCACYPHEIYPGRREVSEHPMEVLKAAVPVTSREAEREALLRNDEKLRAWAKEAHKQMSQAQHEAVKKRLK